MIFFCSTWSKFGIKASKLLPWIQVFFLQKYVLNTLTFHPSLVLSSIKISVVATSPCETHEQRENSFRFLLEKKEFRTCKKNLILKTLLLFGIPLSTIFHFWNCMNVFRKWEFENLKNKIHKKSEKFSWEIWCLMLKSTRIIQIKRRDLKIIQTEK